MFKLLLIVCFLGLISCYENKYSEEVNRNADSKTNGEYDRRPFRIQRLNVLWEKAVKRLSDHKLKNLKTDLKTQDKDEIALKKLKSNNQDKEGLKEAQLKKSYVAILKKYGLEDSVDDSSSDVRDADIEKYIFKDKKLDKLWRKAIAAGFTDEQLKLLKDDFRAQEQLVDEYHQLADVVEHKKERDRKSKDRMDNSIDTMAADEKSIKKDQQANDQQALSEKRKSLKDGYRSLESKISSGLNNYTHFEEEKVQHLWKLAEKSDFNEEERETLKEELRLHENRMKKLKILMEEQLADQQWADDSSDENERKHLKRRIKEISNKIEKTHRYLETKIMQRHIEL